MVYIIISRGIMFHLFQNDAMHSVQKTELALCEISIYPINVSYLYEKI